MEALKKLPAHLIKKHGLRICPERWEQASQSIQEEKEDEP